MDYRPIPPTFFAMRQIAFQMSVSATMLLFMGMAYHAVSEISSVGVSEVSWSTPCLAVQCLFKINVNS